MLRLGIMGGTFDPIHHAHLLIAEEARVTFGLDKIIFVPAGEPPHKIGKNITSAEHRYAMTLLAVESNPAFEVSRIEMDRKGPSYSVETIKQIIAEYGEDSRIFFIVGADEALDLASWYQAEVLPELARFIAVPRPGHSVREIGRNLPKKLGDAVELLWAPLTDISSTDIRQRVVSGRSIRYLIPDGVETYIRKHGLYQEGNSL